MCEIVKVLGHRGLLAWHGWFIAWFLDDVGRELSLAV
jgi:hypothetical protein